MGKRQSSSKERGRRVSPGRAVTLSAVRSEPPPERELAPPWHGHFPQFIPEVWEASPPYTSAVAQAAGACHSQELG